MLQMIKWKYANDLRAIGFDQEYQLFKTTGFHDKKVLEQVLQYLIHVLTKSFGDRDKEKTLYKDIELFYIFLTPAEKKEFVDFSDKNHNKFNQL